MQTHSLMQASGILGVNKTTLQTWLAQGCPAVEQADRNAGTPWKIYIPDVVQWRIDRAVSDAVAAYGGNGSEMSKEEADRRRAVAQAHMAEIELDERTKEVVLKVDIVQDMQAFCLDVKDFGLQAFHKIAVRAAAMKEPNEIREMCEAEWNRAMQLARGELRRRWKQREAGADPDADPTETKAA